MLSGEKGYLCIIPDLRGGNSFFLPLSLMSAVGFSKMPFIRLMAFPPISSLLNAFMRKGYWILSMVFLHLLRKAYGTSFLFG